MDWIKNFDLFLFDFDGLLVNTEMMHYRAYKEMMEARGVHFNWDFKRYCKSAHYGATLFRERITEQYPELLSQVESWDTLYAEKQAAMLKLLEEGKVELMPGVKALLEKLKAAEKKRAVVTHSPNKFIVSLRSQHPVLDEIENWITREQYNEPKPNPECYRLAIQKLKENGDKVIGFEDTPRGLTALMGTEAKPVLVCDVDYPEIPEFKAKGALHFTHFDKVSIS
ncbi:MAG: HAD family phosphatase [Chlamydiia bacterium]|nr:HAD family phosphatase [Chlamydiia bacterium]